MFLYDIRGLHDGCFLLLVEALPVVLYDKNLFMRVMCIPICIIACFEVSHRFRKMDSLSQRNSVTYTSSQHMSGFSMR